MVASLTAHTLENWDLTGIARLHSGDPYTSTFWDSQDQRYNWFLVSGLEMGARYPDYFRLDFRLSHRVGGRFPGAFYVELINATNHQNVFLYTWHFEPIPGGGSYPTRQTLELFPRLPSAGFEIRF